MPELAVSIRGRIIDLKHEDYRGKRIFLVVKDKSIPRGIRTKMDIGVHTHEAIKQVDILFDVPFDKIKVLIHRQSIVHSMVEYNDNSVIAQLAVPDMRHPGQYALTYPDRCAALCAIPDSSVAVFAT